MEVKQVILINNSLNMSPGKVASQAAHAAIAAYDIAPRTYIDAWKRSGTTKIVLNGNNMYSLLDCYRLAVAKFLPASLIVDEGLTEVPGGSITAVAIGPAPKDAINEITGNRELY